MPSERGKLTGDEYMALLIERQEAWVAAHPAPENAAVRVRPYIQPLYEWFIRDGDEDMVDLPPEAAI